jgi:hypothetical protein
MDKVVLPKEVANAIEISRICGYSTLEIVIHSLEAIDGHAYKDTIRHFAADNFDTFLNALVNGYEVVKTTEERLRERYEYAERVGGGGRIYRDAVRDTLDILGIKIEGVNASE